jgi:hypothetical protein
VSDSASVPNICFRSFSTIPQLCSMYKRLRIISFGSPRASAVSMSDHRSPVARSLLLFHRSSALFLEDSAADFPSLSGNLPHQLLILPYTRFTRSPPNNWWFTYISEEHVDIRISFVWLLRRKETTARQTASWVIFMPELSGNLWFYLINILAFPRI